MSSQPPPAQHPGPWQQPQQQPPPWQQPAQVPRPGEGLVDPRDAEATLAARREMGADMEQALVDSFVARVEHAIAERGSTEVGQRQQRLEAAKVDSRNQMILGIVSLALAVPLTAIATSQAGLSGMVITWVAVILVNFAYAMRKGQRGA